jgi:hypothetical protein
MPSSAALMSPALPLNTIVVSPLPSPLLKLRPAMVASVSVPSLALSVNCSGDAAVSMSATLIARPLALDSTSVVFSGVTCRPGSWLTGASLTAPTLLLTLAAAVLKALLPPTTVVSATPPAAPEVWSQAR